MYLQVHCLLLGEVLALFLRFNSWISITLLSMVLHDTPFVHLRSFCLSSPTLRYQELSVMCIYMCIQNLQTSLTLAVADAI